MSFPIGGVILDAAAIRDEILDAGHLYTDAEITAVETATDEELNTAIMEVVNDDFWTAYDRVRSRAIAWMEKETR